MFPILILQLNIKEKKTKLSAFTPLKTVIEERLPMDVSNLENNKNKNLYSTLPFLNYFQMYHLISNILQRQNQALGRFCDVKHRNK